MVATTVLKWASMFEHQLMIMRVLNALVVSQLHQLRGARWPCEQIKFLHLNDQS